jgi:TolB-like protein/Flp pilus assembly protein TadD
MQGESTGAGAARGAVFLSYASEDAAAAARIADALRRAGLEVWLDQSELRGGDAWDRQIRSRIHDCRLFIAVISANTEARDEGYFRREWKLAVDRTHDMSERKAFLLPVVIDRTSERTATVPEKFREVQWTRLPGGEAPPEFTARVVRLLSPEAPLPAHGLPRPPAEAPLAAGPAVGAGRSSPWLRGSALALAAVALATLGYLLIDRLARRGSASPPSSAAAAPPAIAAASPAAFVPPPHSIAVLPFVNLSGDPAQDYFSDGLTEELLNSLAAVEGLQVAARTSSFSFKGKDADIATIAHKLDVASVLEGSVRRSGHTVRITAQLINAVTGFHLWSKTYDRDLGDVLRLQTEIATAVANALEVTLLADTAAKIELGGTRNPAAFDAYLRATVAGTSASEAPDYQVAISAYTEAIRLDPNYALAFAGRSLAESLYSAQGAVGAAVHESFDRAFADGRRAVALAPELAEGHLSLGFYFANGAFDFRQAGAEFERARALAPGNAHVLEFYGLFAVTMGRFEQGLADLRRAVALDPLNVASHFLLGRGLYWSRRYAEALAPLEEATALDAAFLPAYEYRGLAYYGLGDFEKARSVCELKPAYWGSLWCLAVAYEKLGRHADAQAALAKLTDLQHDAASYQYATIYAQWGDPTEALGWLENAMRVRDPGVTLLKNDPFMDPLRKQPRFEAVVRALRFPD